MLVVVRNRKLKHIDWIRRKSFRNTVPNVWLIVVNAHNTDEIPMKSG